MTLMKFLMVIFLCLGALFTGELQASWWENDKVFYGEDNRRLVSELDPIIESDIKEFASAILVQIPGFLARTDLEGNLVVATQSLESGLKICPEERFLDLPLVGSCSAFLIGPDLLLTAGHCVRDKYECKKNNWVFGFDDSAGFLAPSGTSTFYKSNVYSCSELVAQVENDRVDYAIVRLDRIVPGVKPLNIRREGKIDRKEQVYLIGHPLGMPKMISGDSSIRENLDKNLFKTNFDSFSGNSGSPVFGRNSKMVEGILIRGEQDFEVDMSRGCKKIIRCSEGSCKGETVLRSTLLPLKLIPKY